MRSKRIVLIAGFASALLTVAVLFSPLGVKAQQPAGTPAVPANVAPHPAPVQPIPYSHKTHLALGLQCQMCHTNPEPGKLMTFPATSTCMSCHRTVATDKPSIQKLASYAKSKKPIPWVRVYMLTVGVNWSHRKHLDAGVICETCHGQVSEQTAMSQTTGITAMAVCINCHKLNNAGTVCQTCHSWPAAQY